MSSTGAGTIALFSLRDSSGSARFEFYFNGGDSYYTINDSNALVNDSGIPFTASGLHLVFTLVTADTYNLQVTRLSNTNNYTFAGRTLKGTAGNALSQLRFFYRNSDVGNTACQDFFFNVGTSVGGSSDNAANYSTGACGTTTWTNGSNNGQGPLTDGGSISGSATATLQLSNVGNADSNSIYSVIVYNPYGAVKSATGALSVNTSGHYNGNAVDRVGAVGTAYSKTLTSSGGTSPYTYAITSGALPPGITLSAGVLSGTPTNAGTYNFTVSVTDSSSTLCSGSSNLSITVNCPAITVSSAPSTLLNGSVGVSYSASFSATSGNGPYTFSSTGTLPSGLTLTSAGTLSGTPTAASTYSFSIVATDIYGCTGSHSYNITMANCTAITLSPASPAPGLPGGTVGTPYSQNITASGGNSGSFAFTSTGTLPAGLTLTSPNSTTATLSGTPTTPGTYNFNVIATDNGSGCQQSIAYTVIISCPTITLSSLTSGTAGTAYDQTITASGLTGSFTFQKTSGTLPPGLTLETAR